MPTYKEMADDIAARIERGDWEPGDRLPTTDQFRIEYGVSEATAYRALVLLIDRGVIYGEHGRGRFVSKPAQ
jgi:GntR family transcriptional regulator